MHRNNTTFELNGRNYDALTGAMLGTAPRRQPAAVSIDGMVGAKKPVLNVPSARLTTQPKHVAAHQPQPTKTLMRRGVRTPAAQATAHAKPVATLSGFTKQTAVHAKQLHGSKITKKLSSAAVDPRKAVAAQQASQHASVRRFSPVHQPALSAIPVPAPVPTPPKPATLQPQSALRPHNLARQHNNFGAPTRRPATIASPQSLRRPSPQTQANALAIPVPAPPRHHQAATAHDEQDIFSQALAQATSHEEPAPKVKTRNSRRRAVRAWGMAGTFAILMGLFGFIAFQNRDDIRLQIASAKAGFSAAAPLYKPDGYKLSDMKYATGSVASIYQQGNQNFVITQKKSNWDSQTLLENFVANANQDYEGFQANGRTVYVYGDGNATWVNGGIWYQIKATGNLTGEQLVKIAASM